MDRAYGFSTELGTGDGGKLFFSGLSTPIQSARPTPGFGLKWSLNAEDPVVRTNADFGLKPGRDFVQGIVH